MLDNLDNGELRYKPNIENEYGEASRERMRALMTRLRCQPAADRRAVRRTNSQPSALCQRVTCCCLTPPLPAA